MRIEKYLWKLTNKQTNNENRTKLLWKITNKKKQIMRIEKLTIQRPPSAFFRSSQSGKMPSCKTIIFWNIFVQQRPIFALFENIYSFDEIDHHHHHHLEETVVGANREVVGLGDVVHQSPEVLHSIEGRHLQDKLQIIKEKFEQKSSKQWQKPESREQRDMKQTNRHGTNNMFCVSH